MGSFTIRRTSRPAIRPASLVACRWLSLKYAGTVMTACSRGSPKKASARCLRARRTWADTSGGVTALSPTLMRTTSALARNSKGQWQSSSLMSSYPRPMKRLTE